jgi:hypothetical protein
MSAKTKTAKDTSEDTSEADLRMFQAGRPVEKWPMFLDVGTPGLGRLSDEDQERRLLNASRNEPESAEE